MKTTPYNKDEAIEYLMALSLKLLMSDEVKSLDGENAAKLFDVVGGMDEQHADKAISVWERNE